MKLGVVTSNSNFLQPIIDELLLRGHDVNFFQMPVDAAGNVDMGAMGFGLGQVLENSERIFIDFAQDPHWRVVDSATVPVVLRMHRMEIYNEGNYILRFPDGSARPFPWNKVERVLFVAEHVKDRFTQFGAERFAIPPSKLTVLPHVGVDLKRFAFAERNWEPPWTILLAGHVVPKKRQYTTLQLLKDLPEEFQLRIIGGPGMPGYGNGEYPSNCTDYIESAGLGMRVTPKQHVDPSAMPEEYAQSHLILSASNEEGCATTVAEGMATGCLPLVNAWRGADKLYPKSGIWDSPKAFYRLCEEFAELPPEEKAKRSRSARRFVAKRYDQKVIVSKTCDYIQGMPLGEFYDSWLDHFVEQRDNPRNQALGEWLLEYAHPGTSFLEIGCSIGRQCELVRTVAQGPGSRVVGIDLSRACLRYATDRAAQIQASNPTLGFAIEYLLGNETVPHAAIPPGEWDLVAVFDTLEHIHPDKHAALFLAIAAALKPDGRVLLNFPYKAHDDSQIEEFTVFPKVVRAQLRGAGLKCDPPEQVFSPWPGEVYFRVEGVKP